MGEKKNRDSVIRDLSVSVGLIGNALEEDVRKGGGGWLILGKPRTALPLCTMARHRPGTLVCDEHAQLWDAPDRHCCGYRHFCQWNFFWRKLSS